MPAVTWPKQLAASYALFLGAQLATADTTIDSSSYLTGDAASGTALLMIDVPDHRWAASRDGCGREPTVARRLAPLLPAVA